MRKLNILLITTVFILISCSVEPEEEFYEVIYHGNQNESGIVPVDVNEYSKNDVFVAMGNVGNLAKSNYNFIGWNTEPDGSGNPILPGYPDVIRDSDINLYAQWSRSHYIIIYDGNGASSGTTVDNNLYTNLEVVTVISNSYSNQGYAFAKWNTQPDGSGDNFIPNETIMISNSNITLYAQWKYAYFTVSFEINGATSGSSPDSLSNTFTSNILIPIASGLSKENFAFFEWNTTSNGNGEGYQPGFSYTIPSSNTVLYAIWTNNAYTLTYDDNGATNGTAPDPDTISHDINFQPSGNENNMQRAGHIFIGWNTKADGTGIYYSTEQPYSSFNSNATLYAMWKDFSEISFRNLSAIGDITYEHRNLDFYTNITAPYSNTISSYNIGKYEITYELYFTIRKWAIEQGYVIFPGQEGSTGGSGLPSDNTNKYQPVVLVTHNDTIAWCNAYSEYLGLGPVYFNDPGFNSVYKTNSNSNPYANVMTNGYRLPTEAEWVLAAQYNGSGVIPSYYLFIAANRTYWNYGDLPNYGWIYPNSDNRTHVVGLKQFNTAGTYDQTGNAAEWVWNWIETNPTTSVTNYWGPISGSFRQYCGGNYTTGDSSFAHTLAVGYKDGTYQYPHLGSDRIGFRIARYPYYQGY